MAGRVFGFPLRVRALFHYLASRVLAVHPITLSSGHEIVEKASPGSASLRENGQAGEGQGSRNGAKISSGQRGQGEAASAIAVAGGETGAEAQARRTREDRSAEIRHSGETVGCRSASRARVGSSFAGSRDQAFPVRRNHKAGDQIAARRPAADGVAPL